MYHFEYQRSFSLCCWFLVAQVLNANLLFVHGHLYMFQIVFNYLVLESYFLNLSLDGIQVTLLVVFVASLHFVFISFHFHAAIIVFLTVVILKFTQFAFFSLMRWFLAALKLFLILKDGILLWHVKSYNCRSPAGSTSSILRLWTITNSAQVEA